MNKAIDMAIAKASKLVIYPFIFFINAQKIKMTGMAATKADKGIFLRGSIV